MESGSDASVGGPGGDSTTHTTHTLESSVDQLETLFNQTEAELSYISRKLEIEFSANYSAIASQALNPNTALVRIEEMRAKLAELAPRLASVEERKATMTVVLKTKCQELDAGVADLEALGDPSRTQTEAPSAEVTRLVLPAKAAPERSTVVAAPPAKPGRGAGAFKPLSRDEFESVSTLVRGRCKVDEVNTVYEVIHKAFRKQKNSNRPLTIKDMTAMGLKITGQSGEGKLRTLRQLKIITISNRDKSVVLCDA
eukprot:m.50449 g.50449  ORF g.50449 m.50449 type:complete len:255 (+) comp16316_c0_seq1:24-788(+)